MGVQPGAEHLLVVANPSHFNQNANRLKVFDDGGRSLYGTLCLLTIASTRINTPPPTSGLKIEKSARCR